MVRSPHGQWPHGLLAPDVRHSISSPALHALHDLSWPKQELMKLGVQRTSSAEQVWTSSTEKLKSREYIVTFADIHKSCSRHHFTWYFHQQNMNQQCTASTCGWNSERENISEVRFTCWGTKWSKTAKVCRKNSQLTLQSSLKLNCEWQNFANLSRVTLESSYQFWDLENPPNLSKFHHRAFCHLCFVFNPNIAEAIFYWTFKQLSLLK